MNTATSEEIKIKGTNDDTDSGKFAIKLDKKLDAGHNYTIELAFTGKVDKSLHGIYYTSYEEDGITQ